MAATRPGVFMNDTLAAITDRLIQRYGKAGVEQLKTATFTREQLLSPSLDPDRYAFLMSTRAEEVEAILNAEQISAQTKANAAATSLKKFYDGVRSGKNTPEVVALWLKTNFTEDFNAFRISYPQTAPSEQIWQHNIAIIVATVAASDLAPNYDSLVRAYEFAMNPTNGAMPTLRILCPGGQILTGKPLKDAIRQWSIELLEPAMANAAPVQSADEFLNEHPELKDTRPPQLLKERYEREFQRFLVSDVGRAWRKRMSDYGHLEKSAQRMWDYVTQHQLELNQKSFEVAAVSISDEISVTLDQNDIGGARVSNTFIHDAGGNRANQIPLGDSGMAGQYIQSPYNPDKEWTEAAVRRELKMLSAHDLQERLADKAFVEALNRYDL
jgi:hypothetical protein